MRIMLIAVPLIAVLGLYSVIIYGTVDTVSFRVDHRERVTMHSTNGPGESRYMVWGETNGVVEVFENTDSLLFMKWNSADLYGEMSEGAECDATVAGWRVPFLSWNRNIIEVDCTRAAG